MKRMEFRGEKEHHDDLKLKRRKNETVLEVIDMVRVYKKGEC